MDDLVVWLIIALFYAPLHYLLPLLLVWMRSSEAQRRSALRHTLFDCSLSMLAAFGLVIWLVKRDRIGWAMAWLLCSLALPYIRILAGHRRSREG